MINNSDRKINGFTQKPKFSQFLINLSYKKAIKSGSNKLEKTFSSATFYSFYLSTLFGSKIDESYRKTQKFRRTTKVFSSLFNLALIIIYD